MYLDHEVFELVADNLSILQRTGQQEELYMPQDLQPQL